MYFTAILYILWAFGIFYGKLVQFFLFWYIAPRKIWQPWLLVLLYREINYAKEF
jgi:hypothetical protein